MSPLQPNSGGHESVETSAPTQGASGLEEPAAPADGLGAEAKPRGKAWWWAAYVAAVPVIGGTLAFIIKGPAAFAVLWGVVSGPHVKADVPACTDEEIVFRIRNSGGRAGHVRPPRFFKEIDGLRSDQPIEGITGSPPFPSDLEVPPLGDWRSYSYKPIVGKFFTPGEAGVRRKDSLETLHRSCAISVELSEFVPHQSPRNEEDILPCTCALSSAQ
jgi:hypothetical protein